MKRVLCTKGVLAACALTLMAATAISSFASSADVTDANIARAVFDSSDRAVLPVDYRQWQHVGTRYKPDGINILDGLPAKTPEVLNAYVEPSAFAAFEKTGKWPDGAQIVKEFSAVQVGDGCDPQTHVCTNKLGRGLYESNYIGLGMMIKDAKRFPDSPGNWGYFSFGHKPLPYDPVATVKTRAQCSSCHEKLASDTDFVISRAHIGLDDNQKLRFPTGAKAP